MNKEVLFEYKTDLNSVDIDGGAKSNFFMKIV